MEIRISHHFPCTPREYWDATRGPVYEEDLRRDMEMDVVVLERREEGSRLWERVRVSPRKELPVVMAKAIGASRLSYVQEVDSNSDDLTMKWRVIMDAMPEKVTCAGTSRVIASPAGGCERIIEGEITVGIPLVGRIIEKHVVEGIAKSYDRAAVVAARHLPSSGGAPSGGPPAPETPA